MKARRCNLLIKRQTKTNISEAVNKCGVYEHEIPIYLEMYGEGNVTQTTHYKTELAGRKGRAQHHQDMTDENKNKIPYVYPVVLIDAEPEYARLEAKFGMHPTMPIPTVERVYGTFSEGKLESYGTKHYAGEKGIDEQDWMDSERERVNEGHDKGYKEKYDLSLLNIGQLRRKCNETGVDFVPKDTKATIINKLVGATAGV